MATATAKGVPYPQSTDAANVPSDMGNLAAWIDSHAWGGIYTTTARDLLSGANLWAGMVIFNSTTGQIELNASGSAGSGFWAAQTITEAQVTGLVADLAAKAALASPAFTGTPTAPTPTAGDNSTKVATTAFLVALLASYATLASPTFTGTPAVPTATTGTNTTQAASTAFVLAQLLAGLANEQLIAPTEKWTLVAAAATGTINFDCMTQGVLYYTNNASANWVLNLRGNASTTLASLLAVGVPITVTFVNTNGATPYIPSSITIDGVTVTPKWSGGVVPSAGNANALDVYQLTIIKTASTPTYTVLASGPVKYA